MSPSPKDKERNKDYQIINGDCLQIMKGMADKSVDLVVTSPPYNMRLRIRNGKYTEREKGEHFSKKYKFFDDALPMNEFYEFHSSCIREMLRVSKIIAYNFQIVTGSKEAFFRIIGEFSNNIKDIIIWDKGFGQPAMNEGVLNSAYEFILILESGDIAGRKITNSYFKRGEMQNILRINRGKQLKGVHQATFPLKLVETLIRNFSKENDLILDPFAGSCTTLIAAKQLNRRCICIEKEEDYVKICHERFEKVTNNLF